MLISTCSLTSVNIPYWISQGRPMKSGNVKTPLWKRSNQLGVKSGVSVKWGGSSIQSALMISPEYAVKAWSSLTILPVPLNSSKRFTTSSSVRSATMGSNLVMPALEKYGSSGFLLLRWSSCVTVAKWDPSKSTTPFTKPSYLSVGRTEPAT